jgi:hypothetical protein
MRVVYANASGVCAGREEEEEGSDYEGIMHACGRVESQGARQRGPHVHAPVSAL